MSQIFKNYSVCSFDFTFLYPQCPCHYKMLTLTRLVLLQFCNSIGVKTVLWTKTNIHTYFNAIIKLMRFQFAITCVSCTFCVRASSNQWRWFAYSIIIMILLLDCKKDRRSCLSFRFLVFSVFGLKHDNQISNYVCYGLAFLSHSYCFND